MKKVIIVDDEAPARALVRQYLGEYPDLVIVGECNNGVDALRLIKEFRPDLVFMDVQMPGMTGFEVLERLDEVPLIIFSTAYDQYALEAFEINAVDYLLKPYTRERFAKAIRRIELQAAPLMDQLQRLAESLKPESQEEDYSGKLFVQSGNKLLALEAMDIVWLEAEKDYTWLITAEKRHLSSYGLGALEQKLNPRQFVRVHRSSIIHLKHVQEIEKYPSGYDIRMSNGDTVRVSRSYIDEIRKRLL
ncbi:MAG: LytR/AlgR family response regulator transcription factor [Bacteroidia bacterium]